MYASFRWTRNKHYVVKMAVFVALASLLPAFFADPFYGGTAFWAEPASVLSFPFYSEKSLPGTPSALRYYDAHFLTLVIYSTKSSPALISPFHLALLLFMLVNSLGSALGYWMNKKRVVPDSHGWRSLLLLSALGVAAIAIGVWLFNILEWSDLQRRFDKPFIVDGWRFGTFGFTWLAAVFWDFLLHRVESESKGSI